MTEPAPPNHLWGRPRDKHGRIVPWFVGWVNGVPDFRTMDSRKLVEAVRFNKCWLCGRSLGANKVFVVGPMCAINRTSAEPPSHLDCARYAAQVCPFLTTPRMTRREHGLPEDSTEPAGIMLRRNPGVCLIWVTKSYRVHRDGDGVLFGMGEPAGVHWYAEGRPATRDEVLASIDSGLPALRQIAEDEGPAALAELERAHTAALELVPAHG